METHEDYMQVALDHARSMAGETWPNPFVGAVLVQGGEVVSKAATAKGGRPHAETQAIEKAKDKAKGATLYVTLEPCAHDGETPACVDAVINAGIGTVVIAREDPDPRTSGKAIQKLRDSGIEVIENILSEQARWQHRGFFTRLAKNRPWITLKLATSLDGKVALDSGESKWITGEKAREFGHMMRAEADAILSTSRSVANDDARLTCRIPGLERRTPVRVVIDRHLRLKDGCNLFASDASPVWVMTHVAPEENESLPPHIEYHALKASQNWLEDMFSFMGERGVNHVLVEVGGTFATALLSADLVDELCWFRAPIIIGDDGISAVKGLNVDSLDGLRHWQLKDTKRFDDDQLDVLVKMRAE